MEKPFDIFWFGDNGPNWIEAVETLEIAKAHIEKFPQKNSGGYGVLDQRNGRRTSFAVKMGPVRNKKSQGSTGTQR